VARLRLTVAALIACAGIAACGGGDATSATPSATAPPEATPTATATGTPPKATAPSAPSPPPDAPTPTPTATGENQPGGGGDEAGARVPVAITVGSDGQVSPAKVDVPAFFAIELKVTNRTAGPLTVRWKASEPAGEFVAATGKTTSRRVAGVKQGSYPLEVSGVGTVTIVAGVVPGP
jgi:hypothetical protein